MAKLTLTDIQSGYASIDALNANFTAIETALENTLSRDGTTPNSLAADLDINSYNLLNVGTINGVDATSLGDLAGFVNQAAQSAADSGASAASSEASAVSSAVSAVNAASSAISASDSEAQALLYTSLGLGGASAFDLGSVLDSFVLFPTDWGTLV